MELARTHELLCWMLERPIFRGKVTLLHQGEELGLVGFWAGEEGILLGPNQELQLQIHPPWQGNGLGTKLLAGTVEYIHELQEHYGFSPRRIYAQTLWDNIAVQRALEANGFLRSSLGRSYCTYERKG
jgi:RimJ/RimL family protein N-acetyltransferase